MTVKPLDDVPMNGQQLRTIADTIPGVLFQFYARGSGEWGPGRMLAGTTGTGDNSIDTDGRVPYTNREYHCLTGHRTIEKTFRESMVEGTVGYWDEKNAGAVFPHAGIIIRKPEGTWN